MDIERIITEEGLSKRNLAAFKQIIAEVQPYNIDLYSKIDKYINTNFNDENAYLINLTIKALFEALDYPTEEWQIKEESQYRGYKYLKSAIIEYALTPYKNIDIILDNVAFVNKTNMKTVHGEMMGYIANHGDPKKIQNAFKIYSNDYENAIYNSTNPAIFIPIYAKAVTTKFKEMTKDEENHSSYHM